MITIKNNFMKLYRYYKDFGFIKTSRFLAKRYLNADRLQRLTPEKHAKLSRLRMKTSIPKRLKILLVNPPFHRLHGLEDVFFPIGLGYLASMLDIHGFNVKIYNMENSREQLPLKWSDRNLNQKLLTGYESYLKALDDVNHPVWHELREVLREEKPDVLGLTAKSPCYPSAKKVAALYKKSNPEGIAVLGGPHATLAADEVIQDGIFNFCVRGEGEQTFLDLCTVIENGTRQFSHIAGLSYPSNGVAHHTFNRGLQTNIDEFPFPAKDLSLFPERYPVGAMGHIISSRGCPFRCGYCAQDKLWSRKVRFQTTERTIAEIKELKELYGISSFYFWDDSFTVNRKRIVNLCEALIAQGISIIWNCTTRVDLVDEESLGIMYKAGCRNIDVGIESGSERILKLIHKGITIDKVHESIDMIKKAGIQCNAFFMLGFPDETEEDIRLTLDFIRSTKAGIIALSIFTPYPGCALFDRAKELSLLPDKINWAELSHHSAKNYFVKNLSRERFQEYVMEAAALVDRHNHAIS